MPDYKEMYRKLLRASEDAINVLIAAQRECEELYVSAPEPEWGLVALPKHSDEAKHKKGGSG